MFVHVTLVPFIGPSTELKTKPTQHSVSMLRSYGISPDLIVLRSEQELTDEIKSKVSLFCDVSFENVINAPDLDCLLYTSPSPRDLSTSRMPSSA